MQDNNGHDPEGGPAPQGRREDGGYSPFQKTYMALTVIVVLAVLSAGGWGVWRYMTHGFMSFELEELVDRVASGDGDDVAAAADEIVDLGYEAGSAVPFLAEMVADPESPNRVVAAEILGRLEVSADEAIAALGDAASDTDEALRHAALQALSQIGTPANAVAGAIIEQLAAADPETRRLAARTLGDIAFLNIEAEDALVAALVDSEARVRVAAVAALIQTGAEIPDGAIGMLTEFLSNPDAEIRDDAILALGSLGPDAAEALPAVEAALADESGDVRKNAAWTLGRMGDAQAARTVPLLVKALETDTDEDVRRQAAWALGQMGAAAAPAADSLRAALDDTGESVGREAFEALKIMTRAKGGEFDDLEEALDSYRAQAGSCRQS